MQTLTFAPGDAFLASDSHVAPWRVIFEDEGVTGYFYACDRSRATGTNSVEDESVLDAMLIYNVGALAASDARLERPTAERIAVIEWSRDGRKAVLYLDGTAQALFDFGARCGYSRMNFPNFIDSGSDEWRKSSHAWSEAVMEEFESALFS